MAVSGDAQRRNECPLVEIAGPLLSLPLRHVSSANSNVEARRHSARPPPLFWLPCHFTRVLGPLLPLIHISIKLSRARRRRYSNALECCSNSDGYKRVQAVEQLSTQVRATATHSYTESEREREARSCVFLRLDRPFRFK